MFPYSPDLLLIKLIHELTNYIGCIPTKFQGDWISGSEVIVKQTPIKHHHHMNAGPGV